MIPTPEQNTIVSAPLCDLTLIQAFAGTGKTTTLRLIAESKPQTYKVLYVCFGKENQLETERKFDHLKEHVKTTTFDGFTYRLFKENRTPGPLSKWICSRELHIDVEDAEDVAKELATFVTDVDKPLRGIYAKRLWQRLCEGKTNFTNFAYMRKRFLMQVQEKNGWTEGYDLLLVDECQDLNPVMLEALLLFSGPKVFVGDRFQHIFSFMGTVDSFERLSTVKTIQRWTLSKSFRFGAPIADLASSIANSMFYKTPYPPIKVVGNGDTMGRISYYDSMTKFPPVTTGHVAILAVKNQTLLRLAFEAAEAGKRIHFVGKEQFFNLLDQEYQIYLAQGPAIIQQKRDTAMWNEDSEMASVCATILEFGSGLPTKLNSFKRFHVPTVEARYIFCTIHRSKGLEFDRVKLLDDFEAGKARRTGTELLESMDEKNRLYYVGVTRAKYQVWFPSCLCREFRLSTSAPARQKKINATSMAMLSATKVVDI